VAWAIGYFCPQQTPWSRFRGRLCMVAIVSQASRWFKPANRSSTRFRTFPSGRVPPQGGEGYTGTAVSFV
jgi:hypothetical protein